MNEMVWNFIIIGAVVFILIILLRRIPSAKKLQQPTEVTSEEITTFGLIAQADESFEKKDFDDAERLYIQVAAQDPNNSKIYTRLGAIYLEQKNYYDAKDSFLQATKLEPELASRHINLGLAYMGLKDYFKAAQAFQEAVKLDKKNKKYQKLLERVQKSQGKEKKKT